MLALLTKHALKPDQRLRLETEARTGEWKIEQAKAQSAKELQQLLAKPSTIPNSQPGHHMEASAAHPTRPVPHPPSRIERTAHRDPVGEQVLTGKVMKCSYSDIIEVTRHYFQESGVTCVECPTCGARRNFKSPKDHPLFPSHPRRKSPPPKGEQR